MDKKSSRALILIISTFTYLLFGAYVFDLLESKADYELRDELTYIRYLLQKKYNFTTKDFSLFETIAVKSIPHKAGYQWKFAGAFYFSTVVITTVGYGHSAPETLAGRLFCMLFALAGIPLGLVMFQSIGERVNTMIASCLHRIRSLLRSCGFQILPKITPTHLIITSLSIGSTIILIGTYVFHRNERWTLFEAYYYCVITLSTIGFGDYVPLQKEGILQKDPVYVLFTLFFVLTGLAVFSACVNLLVLRFMASNTDPVSAAAREPPKTVVFELLASRTLASRSWDPQRKTSAYSSNYRVDK
ncbi:unnamed protein product, partial [Mesorhabditis belari]|uniref:Potassium channel domain-containing protein n=1 Tax=Mesorhabditis belari TaxID=2138241 RepID=A0AAF3EUS3_9BILA